MDRIVWTFADRAEEAHFSILQAMRKLQRTTKIFPCPLMLKPRTPARKQTLDLFDNPASAYENGDEIGIFIDNLGGLSNRSIVKLNAEIVNSCVHNPTLAHFRSLLRVPDEDARVWYMSEAAHEN